MFVDFNILNQLGSPSINSNTFANRPSAGQVGRLFVSTDTFEIYRDTGTGWDLIGGPGSSTVTGSGAAGQVTYWTGSNSVSGENNLWWDAAANHLGINTITPGAALDIHSGADVGMQLNGTGATPNIYIDFLQTGTSQYRLGYTDGAIDDRRFSIYDVTGAKEVLTIDKQSRFVGINYQYSSLADQPAYTLDVSGSGRFTDSAFFATNNVASVGINTTTSSGKLHIVSETDGVQNMTLTRYGGVGYGPHMVANAYRGTLLSPTALQTNDQPFKITANGYNGTTNLTGGLLKFVAAENYTVSACGTNLEILLASIGATAETTKLVLTANGILSINNGSPSSWNNTSSAIQVGALSSLANLGGIDTSLLNNAYYNGTNYIYIQSQEASHYLINRNTHKWYNAPAGTAGSAITFTQRASIEASGNLLVGTSTETANAGVIQISNGLTFPATQVDVSNSNTLDDYEQGTFTPVITGTTTAGTATYTDQNGRYTKIGNVVYFRIDCIWSGHTGTGNLTITGFPFNVAQQYMCVGVVRFDQAITALYYLGGHYIFSATFYLQQMPVGGGGPLDVPITASGDIRISGFYIV